MEKSLKEFTELQYDIRLLENTLAQRAYADHIRLAEYLDEDELHQFGGNLHRVLWECLAMYRRMDMPVYEPYEPDHHFTAAYISLIQMTRAWLQFGQETLIDNYRYPTPAERSALDLLRQLHCALIGHVYWDHAGMATCAAHEVRFYS